jgi:hypothetical protein
VRNFIKTHYGVIGVASSIHKTVLRELGKLAEEKTLGVDFKAFIAKYEEMISTVVVYGNRNRNRKQKDGKEEGGVGEETKLYPTTDQVKDEFGKVEGGTEKMALAFFGKHDKNHWMDRNDKPIKNWKSMIPSFIFNWLEHDKTHGRNKTSSDSKQAGGKILRDRP